MVTMTWTKEIIVRYLEVRDGNGKLLVRSEDFSPDPTTIYKDFTKFKRAHPDCNVGIIKETCYVPFEYECTD